MVRILLPEDRSSLTIQSRGFPSPLLTVGNIGPVIISFVTLFCLASILQLQLYPILVYLTIHLILKITAETLEKYWGFFRKVFVLQWMKSGWKKYFESYILMIRLFYIPEMQVIVHKFQLRLHPLHLNSSSFLDRKCWWSNMSTYNVLAHSRTKMISIQQHM